MKTRFAPKAQTSQKMGLILSASLLILNACSSQTHPSSTTQPIAEGQFAPAGMPAPPPSPAVMMMESAHAPMKRHVTAPMPMPILMQNTEKYGKIDPNPIQVVAQNPISTFSVDVDTGSYANVRRYLNAGNLPPTDAVRIEELINYFDYGYEQPKQNQPFALHTEVVDSVWKKDAKIIKIGLKAQDLKNQELPPANLVFLVDVSGSMNSPDKLPLVKKTLSLLAEQLRPQDKISLVTYAGAEKLVLPATSGSEKQKILNAINELNADGSTAGERGIQLAYQQAQKAFTPNGINRILLATDGDFNVGITSFDALKDLVAEKRKSGISLTTLGFGTGNYNEHLMEQLADSGDGNYSYIDHLNEAQKVLHRQLSSTLATVAQDVKIQVEFNPATVKEYRLIGYENRVLNQEDFNNDQVDAGDIGAGHSVTALYEIIPTGKQGWLEESRYQNPPKQTHSEHAKEWAFVKLRYKKPNEKQSLLISQAIPQGSKSLSQARPETQFAIAVASYGQQLQGGKYNGDMTWEKMIELAEKNSQNDEFKLKKEFIQLANTAWKLSTKPLD